MLLIVFRFRAGLRFAAALDARSAAGL